MQLYTGVVENRNDPLKLGRCQVRITGLHTENKSILPTDDLPWAYPIQPLISAAMNGIGWSPVGPVCGTWVVISFRDDDLQQPIMLGTIGGIPQSTAGAYAAADSDDAIIATNGGVLTDGEGNPVTDGSGNPIQVGTQESSNVVSPNIPSVKTAPKVNNTEQKVPNAATQDTLSKAIPFDPPPWAGVSNKAQVKANIAAIIAACDELGMTSKYAKAGILAIAGGETLWQPIEEGHYYSSAEYLKKTFGHTFKTVEEAQPYVKWQGTKKDWFNVIYRPSGNGKLVSNTQPNDGGDFYGRGYIQITGRGGYQQMQNFLKKQGITIDLMNNPSSIIGDARTSALACVGFFKMNVKTPQDDPGFFIAARARCGADAGGGYAKKEKYYNYFLGQDLTTTSTNKPAADDQKVYTKEEVKDLPPAKQTALLEDRSANQSVGFVDPSGKYPLRNLMDEPDTNRLARGIIKETAIEFKDSTRTQDIEAANGADTWEQPLAPFGGVYPYNKIFESEGGHIQQFDDTPTNETLSLYHRAGSFLEWDANGTQVNKIIGDGYTIYDRNGFISIVGKANLTVGQGVNIYVKGAADIQVDGPSTINLNNNADIGVGGDLNVAVGGNIQVSAGGSIDMKAGTKFGIEAASTITNKAGTTFGLTAGENVSMKAAGKFYADSAGDTHIHAAGAVYNTAGGDNHIRAGGNINVDGTQFHGQEGAAGTADGAPAVEANAVDLTAPDFQNGSKNTISILSTPVRPSPPVLEKKQITDDNSARVEDYIKTPDKYYNKEAEAVGSKPNVPPPPKDSGTGQSLISGAQASDLYAWLTKHLEAAGTGYWRETGQNSKPSNPNILRIWQDLGYKGAYWETDQTPWCMGFVAWSLKQCGYRYYQTASSWAIRDATAKFGATKVDNYADAQPGDIALFKAGHVAFVYRNKGGLLSFVGGNQMPGKGVGPPVRDPKNDGDVSESYIGPCYSDSRFGQLVGIWRPSKA